MILALEHELYGAIASIRAIARSSAFDYASLYYAGITPSGMSGRIEDIRRAKLYAGNAKDFAIDTLREGGPVIKRLDSRLVTIGITENANAYNAEHRQTVLDVADDLDLIEVWDAYMDACPVCWDLNGTEAIDGNFPSGATPGGVHARCRCTSHFIKRRILH